MGQYQCVSSLLITYIMFIYVVLSTKKSPREPARETLG